MGDIVADVLVTVEAELGARLAPEKRTAIEEKIRHVWGGQEVYVKKGDAYVWRGSEGGLARDQDIRARYNGRNRRELMAEYGIGRTQFYKIIKGQ